MDKAARESYGTSLLPEHKTMLKRLAADIGRDANQILEEGIEAIAKKNKQKSDAYQKFIEKR